MGHRQRWARLALAGTIAGLSPALGLGPTSAAAADTWSASEDVSPASNSATTGVAEATLPDGDRLVVWIHDNGSAEQLKVRRWDAGTQAWAPVPLNLTATNSDLADPSIVVSQAGTASVLWRQHDGSYDVVHTRRLLAGSATWGADTTISSTSASASGVSAVVDANGVVTAGWRSTSPGVQRTVVVRSNQGAAVWGAPHVLTAVGEVGRTPVLAASRDGDAMALFGLDVGADTELRAARFDPLADAWDTPGPIQAELGSQDSVGQAIVGLGDGSFLAAWVRRGSTWSVVTSRWTRAAGWSTFDAAAGTEQLATLDTGGEFHDLTIVASPLGGALVAWLRDGQNQHSVVTARMSATGAFSAATVLDTRTDNLRDLTGTSDRADNVTLAWIVYGNGLQRTTVARRAGDVWQAATTLSSPFGTSYAPRIAIRDANAVDVVWSESGIVRLSTLEPSPPPVWSDTTIGTLRVGVPFADGVHATGVPAPVYAVSGGALPGGLWLDASSGTLTGVPTTAGPFDVTIRASSLGGSIDMRFTGSVEPAVPFYVPLTPERLFDTRAGESPNALRDAGTLPVGPDHPIEISVTNLPGGITPATGIAAVSLNVVATGSTQPGYVTVWDCATRPFAANLNHTAGQTIGNAVIAPVSPTGSICLWALHDTHVIADLNGWFPTPPPGGSGYHAVTPERLFDTRAGESPNALRDAGTLPVGPDHPIEISVTSLPGGEALTTPPTGIAAVSLNVVATGSTQPGYVTVWDCATRPFAANLNHAAGETIGNAVIAPVSPTGTICFWALHDTHVIADLNGWFPTPPPGVAGYHAVTPVRLFDTRAGESPNALRDAGTLPVGPDHPIEISVTNLPGGITPATGIAAVSLNVVATSSTQPGYVTVWDCATRPFAANLNHTAGQTIGNAVIAPVSPAGTICLWALHDTHVIADLNGWFPAS